MQVREHNDCLKQKISIALSQEVLERIDRLAGCSRSVFIEAVLRRYLREVESRDLRRLNRAAKWLSREAADVLKYQVLPESFWRRTLT